MDGRFGWEGGRDSLAEEEAAMAPAASHAIWALPASIEMVSGEIKDSRVKRRMLAADFANHWCEVEVDGEQSTVIVMLPCVENGAAKGKGRKSGGGG